jgi:hypothetical protein
MNDYQAPLADMRFVLRELLDLEQLAQLPGFGEVTADVADAVLDEAAKFAGSVLSPLNRSGDLEGVRWQDGEVLTAAGWKQAYGRFAADGWNALSCPAEFGGQNLPRVLSSLIEEMWNGANIAFALCPMLTRGAIDAIELRGPGIDGTAILQASLQPHDLFERLAINVTLFPRGIDVVLVHDDAIVAIPRTTRVAARGG